MVAMKLYVEGGGNRRNLKTACRRGFTEFLKRAGVTQRPRIIAAGGGADALDRFRIALGNNEPAMLLIDSEGRVNAEHQQGDSVNWKPWAHLAPRGDDWHKPNAAQDMDCHLMVQCMEAWLIADREALAAFFGPQFQENQLPHSTSQAESIDKDELLEKLKKATKGCKGNGYDKGSHSFELLEEINPARVMAASPWAERFISFLKERETP